MRAFAKALAIVACSVPTTVTAAPPPPPPDYVAEAAKTLFPDLKTETLDSYAVLFAEDVKVYTDGKKIVDGKSAWMKIQKDHIGNVKRHVIGSSEGASLIIVESVDDRSDVHSAPGMIYDDRFVVRAIQYGFGADHLIHTVQILQGGTLWDAWDGVR